MMNNISMTRSLLLLGALAAGACGQSRPDAGAYDALSATVWFQTAGEFRALCYQAYTLAALRLETDVRDSVRQRPRAVIVDVDETVLDNSPHQAKLLETGTAFPSWWKEWVDKASAEAIPGAVEFLKTAVASGVDVFYVTNRSREERAATIRNLATQGFPQADETHVLTREDVSSKERRRLKVGETHDVILLVGDNLADFAQVFERKPLEDRNDAVDRLRSEFGRRFIVLPNTLYGDWESAVMHYGRDLTPEQRHELRMNSLRSFE